MAKSKATHPEGGVEKFLVLPIIVLILAQMGTSGDNGALGLANQQLVDVLGATTPDIQLANMVYSLMAGAFMAAGGLVGTIIGWRTNFRLGAALCAAGELVMALSPNMTIFIWGGRILVGFGASFMIPSVLGLIPFIYHGKNRVLAFGCIGAASGLSAFLPLFLGIVMQFGGFRVTFGALAVYFALVLLLSFKLPAIEKPAEKLKFDGLGTGIAATGLFLFLVGLSRISAWGLIEPFAECPFTIFGISPALPMAILGLILLVILVPMEKRVEQKNGIALLPQSFLKTPQVRAGLVASAITFFFMGVQAILLSPYLQLVAGWSPVLMGVMALAVGIPTFIFSLGIPKFMPNANPRRVIQVGYIVMACAFIPMAFSLHGSEVNGLMWLGLAPASSPPRPTTSWPWPSTSATPRSPAASRPPCATWARPSAWPPSARCSCSASPPTSTTPWPTAPSSLPRSAPPWPSATSRSWAMRSSSRPSPTSPWTMPSAPSWCS